MCAIRMAPVLGPVALFLNRHGKKISVHYVQCRAEKTDLIELSLHDLDVFDQ